MTIYYNKLGSNGRLGNQMFQYSGLRGIASHKGYEWSIPPQDHESTCNYGLFDCFKMTNVKEENIGFPPSRFLDHTTDNFNFDFEFFDNCPDNVNLNSYFQTEKYFKNIENEIREDFEFQDEILEASKEIIDEVGEAIFLHVRRGDYIATPNHHPILESEYYIQALEKFDDDIPVLVFSDDLNWCRDQEFLQSDRFLISENHVKYPNKIKLGDGSIQQSLVPYWDLCLMSLCSGAIIANSSMSWWGAWLQNRRSKVVAPKTWFGSAYSHYDMSDLIPETWEII
jgi:hypothetical protein